MKNLFYSVAVLSLFSFYGCDSYNCVLGEQAVEAKVQALEPFVGVVLNMGANVTLIEGSTYQAELIGPADALNVIDVEIVNGLCQIGTTTCILSETDVQIKLTLPQVETVILNGSGDVETANAFSTRPQRLAVTINGSGNTQLDLPADIADLEVDGSGDLSLMVSSQTDVEANIDGSGDINLQSGSGNFKGIITGSGNIRGEAYTANEARIEIDGSGSAYLTVTSLLHVVIDGSGSVFYAGTPRVFQTINGSGKLERR